VSPQEIDQNALCNGRALGNCYRDRRRRPNCSTA